MEQNNSSILFGRCIYYSFLWWKGHSKTLTNEILDDLSLKSYQINNLESYQDCKKYWNLEWLWFTLDSANSFLNVCKLAFTLCLNTAWQPSPFFEMFTQQLRTRVIKSHLITTYYRPILDNKERRIFEILCVNCWMNGMGKLRKGLGLQKIWKYSFYKLTYIFEHN